MFMKHLSNFACMLFCRILRIIQDPYFYDYLRMLEVIYNFLNIFSTRLPEIPPFS